MNFPTDPILEIIFIGEVFYTKSRTMMSSIYVKKDGGYYRFDWGFAQIALARGQRLNMRPATAEELDHFKLRLATLIIEQNAEASA